jgi:hypothetical protein
VRISLTVQIKVTSQDRHTLTCCADAVSEGDPPTSYIHWLELDPLFRHPSHFSGYRFAPAAYADAADGSLLTQCKRCVKVKIGYLPSSLRRLYVYGSIP